MSSFFVNARSITLAITTAAVSALAPSAHASAEVYTVIESKSAVRVHVGKSGAFSFAGHKHEVLAPVTGSVTADAANLSGSAVDLKFASARLIVSEEGEPKGDAPKVEAVMRGPKVLDAANFPEIHFKTRKVTGQSTSAGHFTLSLVGDISLHGLTREFTVPVTVVTEGGSLTATGNFTLRQDQFGMEPVTAGGGTVKVKNEIEIDFQIVAERR